MRAPSSPWAGTITTRPSRRPTCWCGRPKASNPGLRRAARRTMSWKSSATRCCGASVGLCYREREPRADVMTYLAKPKFHHPGLPKNALGYTHRDYEGTVSTLCAGCGHDSITGAIIQACFELSIEPHRVAKISGIGCSSKTPTYFLGNSHGFNSVHGRMPSVLTGANLANRDLIYLGVSGDGDSASIGFGQFAHAIRRGVNMGYVVENNGGYGLTKGQFSATADRGSKSKRGVTNSDNAIDNIGHVDAAPDRVGELAEADRGAVAVAGHAEIDQIAVGEIRPRQHRRHAAVHQVEAV